MADASGGLATIIRPAFGAAPVVLSVVPPAPFVRPSGRPRSVGMSVVLFLATLGVYGGLWTYLVHEELRQETGRGIGGWRAVALLVVAAPVLAFTLPSEVARARRQEARQCAVRGRSGLWALLPVIGWVVWFVNVQRALNEYWWDR